MNKTTVIILVLVAVVCFLLVAGGVWRHSSESEPDPHDPPPLGALGDLISGFSPRLDVHTLQIASGAATLEDGVLTLQGGEVTILIPGSGSKEPVRRLDLEYLSGPPVTVQYAPSAESEDAQKTASPAPLPGEKGPSLRLAVADAGGLLTITGTFMPGSVPSKVKFR